MEEIIALDSEVILNDLITIITPYCNKGDNLKNLTKETRFIEDLGVNSARLVDIVIDLEDKFTIEIDDESADHIQTIGDAIAVIEAKLA